MFFIQFFICLGLTGLTKSSLSAAEISTLTGGLDCPTLNASNEWTIRIQADALENIRLLKTKELKVFPFKDALDPTFIAMKLLDSPPLIKEEILRRCCYAIVRKYIFTLRPPSVQQLIDTIQKKSENTDELTYIAELDICQSIISVITDSPENLTSIQQHLHLDIIKKHPIKMLGLILQAYQDSKIYFQKLWFPIAMKMEELFEEIKTDPKHLIAFKKYIYENHRKDWRIMSLAFRRMDHIIHRHYIEDIVESAYWTGIIGGRSLRIAQFADPTPILSPNVGYMPMLGIQSRYEAAKFLISLCKHKDEDIATSAKQYIQNYFAHEKNLQIHNMYQEALLKTTPIEHTAFGSKHNEEQKTENNPTTDQKPSLNKELYTSLNPLDYGEAFTEWKQSYNLQGITLQEYRCAPTGRIEMVFSLPPHEGSKKFVLVWRDQYHLGVISHDQPEIIVTFKNNSQAKTLAFMKLCESMETVWYRKQFEKSDAFLVTDFFEDLIINDQYTHETISLSAMLFTAQFGLTYSQYGWGIPSIHELNDIINTKLCLTYLHQTYGKEHAINSYVTHNNQAFFEKSLALIPRPIFMPQHPKSKEMIAQFYNDLWNCNQDIMKAFNSYNNIINHIIYFEEPRHVLLICSMALQKILQDHENKIELSITKSSLYLRRLRSYLPNKDLVDLKGLFQFILKNTQLKHVEDKKNDCIHFIQNFISIAKFIYPIKGTSIVIKKEMEENIGRLTKMASHLLRKNTLQKEILQSVSDLYIFARLRQLPCYFLEEKIDQKLHFITTVYPDTIEIFMRSALEFYLLNQKHSYFYLKHTHNLLMHISYSDNITDTYLSSIFPVSTILWKTSLKKPLIYLTSAFLQDIQKSYDNQSIKSIIKTINKSITIRNNLKILETNEKSIAQLLRESDQLSQITITDLVTNHITPLWQLEDKNQTLDKIKNICMSLNFESKEDIFFLRTLEEAYQAYLTACTTPISALSLKNTLIEIKERFDHPAYYQRLRIKNIPTYRKDGSLAEFRKDFDILSIILGKKSHLAYLKIEDQKHDFLWSLIAPTLVHGEEYVTGFGGGGKMKVKIGLHGQPETTILPLLRYQDIISGKMGKLLQAMTAREAFYYWQRMFNPTSDSGDVIVGTLKVRYADDATEIFGPLTNADGCGFIKASTLGSLNPILAASRPHSIRTPIQTYQALHHCKHNLSPNLFNKTVDECVKLASDSINEYLSLNLSDQASIKDLYSRMITGGIKKGRNFVAIPAKGKNNIIVPLSLKESDVFIGKTPYEQPSNIIVKKRQEVSHLRSDDTKKEQAKFLAQLYGFQYSLLGSTGHSLEFSKGIVVVIPDDTWPYPEIDMILSTKDKKVDSEWSDKKTLPAHGTTQTYGGILTVTQSYGPGSFIAVSTDIQINQFGGDYDGDTLIFEGLPPSNQKFSLLSDVGNLLPPYSTAKINKTFTKSTSDNGDFCAFRFASIVQSRNSNLLMVLTKIYDTYIALKEEYQKDIAEIIKKTGLAQRILTNNDASDTSSEPYDDILMVKKALSSGIKMGADSFKSAVDWTCYQEFTNIMRQLYICMGIPRDPIYCKKLCIQMHNAEMNFPDVLIKARYQMQYFDTLPLSIIESLLSTYPQYKQRRLSQLLMKQMERDDIAIMTRQTLQKKAISWPTLPIDSLKKDEGLVISPHDTFTPQKLKSKDQHLIQKNKENSASNIQRILQDKEIILNPDYSKSGASRFISSTIKEQDFSTKKTTQDRHTSGISHKNSLSFIPIIEEIDFMLDNLNKNNKAYFSHAQTLQERTFFPPQPSDYNNRAPSKTRNPITVNMYGTESFLPTFGTSFDHAAAEVNTLSRFIFTKKMNLFSIIKMRK